MNIKKTCLIVLCLITLFVLMGCDDDGAFVAADSCMQTCTDDYTGEEYGIAIRTLAWYHKNNDLDIDKGCYVFVDVFRGKLDSETGQFIGEDYHILSEEHVDAAEYKLYKNFNVGFVDDNIDAISFDDSYIYQLLYASEYGLVQEENALRLEYEHQIDPCVVEKILTVTAECEKNHAKVICSTEEGEVAREYSSSNTIECTSDSGECEDSINSGDVHPTLEKAIDEYVRATS